MSCHFFILFFWVFSSSSHCSTGRRRGLSQEGSKAKLTERLQRCDDLLNDIDGVDDAATRRARYMSLIRNDIEAKLSQLSVPFDRNAAKEDLVDVLVDATDPPVLAMNPHRCVEGSFYMFFWFFFLVFFFLSLSYSFRYSWSSVFDASLPRVPAFTSSTGPRLSELPAEETEVAFWLQYLQLPPELLVRYADGRAAGLIDGPVRDIVDVLVVESNRFATQPVRADGKQHPSNTRKSNVWKYGGQVTRQELLAFIGVTMLMALKKQPELRAYWSDDPMFNDPFISRTMSRNR